MRKKQTLNTEIKKTVKLLITTLTIIIVVLVIVFLFSTSKSAQQGYVLEQARIQNEQLKNQSENLKAKVTDAQTTSNFEDSQKLEEMEQTPEEALDYLLPEDNN
ncbi:MAG: hypothetical protein WC604_03660 [Candidatus Gracilibacteria bacterium]